MANHCQQLVTTFSQMGELDTCVLPQASSGTHPTDVQIGIQLSQPHIQQPVSSGSNIQQLLSSGSKYSS